MQPGSRDAALSLLPTKLFLEIELEADQHAESSYIRILSFIEVSQAMNEINSEKFEDIFNSVSELYVRKPARQKTYRESITIRAFGDQRFVHAAHAPENDIGCTHQSPL